MREDSTDTDCDDGITAFSTATGRAYLTTKAMGATNGQWTAGDFNAVARCVVEVGERSWGGMTAKKQAETVHAKVSRRTWRMRRRR
jgi:hypothetical protein